MFLLRRGQLTEAEVWPSENCMPDPPEPEPAPPVPEPAPPVDTPCQEEAADRPDATVAGLEASSTATDPEVSPAPDSLSAEVAACSRALTLLDVNSLGSTGSDNSSRRMQNSQDTEPKQTIEQQKKKKKPARQTKLALAAVPKGSAHQSGAAPKNVSACGFLNLLRAGAQLL